MYQRPSRDEIGRRVSGFTPYVYGATLGTPSKGRPGRVLAAGIIQDTTVRRFERELDLNPLPLNGIPATSPCGTRAAYRRHRRHGEEACKACRRAESDYAAARKAKGRQP
jgi:hypothetical protein